jgi:hypothetical protein
MLERKMILVAIKAASQFDLEKATADLMQAEATSVA